MRALSKETLIKAARELLRWDQHRLAAAASVNVIKVRRFETGKLDPDKGTVLLQALEAAGVVFFETTTVDGVSVVEGVALRPEARPVAYKDREQRGYEKAAREAKTATAPSAKKTAVPRRGTVVKPKASTKTR